MPAEGTRAAIAVTITGGSRSSEVNVSRGGATSSAFFLEAFCSPAALVFAHRKTGAQSF